MEPNDLFESFRNAVVGLWNEHLMLPLDPERISQALRTFEIIRARLFDLLVLYPLGIYLKKLEQIREYPEIFHMRPREMGGCLLAINRNAGASSGYWDHPVEHTGNEDVLMSFVDFFDWDQPGAIKMNLVRVRILQFPGHPDLVGAAQLFFCKLVGSDRGMG